MPTLISFYVGFCRFCIRVVLRLLAYGKPPVMSAPHSAIEDHELVPVYSVLIAPYREREVLPQLIQALERLQWPRAKRNQAGLRGR